MWTTCVAHHRIGKQGEWADILRVGKQGEWADILIWAYKAIAPVAESRGNLSRARVMASSKLGFSMRVVPSDIVDPYIEMMVPTPLIGRSDAAWIV